MEKGKKIKNQNKTNWRGESILVIEVGKLIRAGAEGTIAVSGLLDFCVATFSITLDPKIELE
jgi:hypothetical protein